MSSINLNLQARNAGVLRTLWNRLTPTRGAARVAREMYFAAVRKPAEVIVTPQILYEKLGLNDKDIFPGSSHYALALHRAGVTSFTLAQGISITEAKDLLDTMISYRPVTMIAKLKAQGVAVTLEQPAPAKKLIDGIDPDSLDCEGKSAWDYPELKAKMEVERDAALFSLPVKPYGPMFKLSDFLDQLYRYAELIPYRGKLLLERIAREDPELYQQILADKGPEYYEKFRNAKPF